MTPELQIRRATPTDAALLSELGRQTFTEAFADQNNPEDFEQYLSQAFAEKQLQTELQSGNEMFFIAFSDEVPAGYAKLRTKELPPEIAHLQAIELQRMYVLADFQGRKAGRLLMQTCLEEAEKQGFEAVWLGVWEHNVKANDFYKRWDFEKFGEHVFHVGNDPQTDWLLFRKLP
jgi:diamine N-acetyltransferase